MSTSRAISRHLFWNTGLEVRGILIDCAMSIANFCVAQGERWTNWSKWWMDVGAWIGGRGAVPFAEIRAARAARKVAPQ